MFFVSASKAFVALTIVSYTGANPLSLPQWTLVGPNDQPPQAPIQGFNKPQSTAHGSQAGLGGLNVDSIKSGRCYFFTNPVDEHLGSDGGYYAYLKFGSNDRRRPFRLCRELDTCSHGGPVSDHGKFWLQDFHGSGASKGRNIVAGNEYGYLYPSCPGYTNYLHFKAYDDSDVGDGEGYVRLKLVDEKANYNGLEINGANYPYLSSNQQQTISVKFHPVRCPDDEDDMSEL
ncbi:hypothetical protein PMG11_11261 [Penicillium brasilianum]|uniref:Cell wall protein PhiA n=1 Tax=Penicillium brasilianum TaxID=104259 RepID=A0A0F7U3D3_PENBI|nr:hypothetical protein PMG11_11261 [Penicillium brasilianum]